MCESKCLIMMSDKLCVLLNLERCQLSAFAYIWSFYDTEIRHIFAFKVSSRPVMFVFRIVIACPTVLFDNWLRLFQMYENFHDSGCIVYFGIGLDFEFSTIIIWGGMHFSLPFNSSCLPAIHVMGVGNVELPVSSKVAKNFIFKLFLSHFII